MSFKNVKDQSEIAERLQSLLKSSRLPHAMLFIGPLGAGQLEMAKETAKSLFCPEAKNRNACDECAVCRRVNQSSHPDFAVIGTEEKSSVIKVEAIREIIARANMKPFEAPYKVFVVEEADLMNEVSQNAFLKTLEEPPGNTLFILISQAPDKLLSTIRSRCQTFHFRPPKEAALYDEDTQTLCREMIQFLSYDLPAKKSTFSAPDLGELDREEFKKVLDYLMEYFRDALLLRSGAKELTNYSDHVIEKERIAKKFTESELIERIEGLGELKEKLQEMMNLRIVTALLWEKALLWA